MHPNAPNKMLLTSLSYMVAFHEFDLAETFLTRPLLVVADTRAGSLWQSKELHSCAAGPRS